MDKSTPADVEMKDETYTPPALLDGKVEGLTNVGNNHGVTKGADIGGRSRKTTPKDGFTKVCECVLSFCTTHACMPNAESVDISMANHGNIYLYAIFYF